MTETGVLVFARCAGFVWRAPGFSHPSVPPYVRAGFALVLTCALLPAVASMPALHVASARSAPHLVLALASEAALGAAIGFGTSVLYDGAYAAGRLLDDYAGIRGSAPGAALAASNAFGRVWSNALLGAFFLCEGYRIVILAFAENFARIPPGASVAVVDLSRFAAALPAAILRAAAAIAAPAVALIFIVHVALGALARASGRLQTFALSFPLTFGAALIVTAIGIPLLARSGAHPWLVLP